VAERKLCALDLDHRRRQVLMKQQEVHALRLAAQRHLAADDHPARRVAVLPADLRLVPAGAGQRRGDELGADVVFAVVQDRRHERPRQHRREGPIVDHAGGSHKPSGGVRGESRVARRAVHTAAIMISL
jgi:hypothetical protein